MDRALLLEMEADSEEETDLATGRMEELRLAGDEMTLMKRNIDELEAELKEMRKHYDHLRFDTVPELMVRSGIANGVRGSFTVSTGERIQLQSELRVGCEPEDKLATIRYMTDNGVLYSEAVLISVDALARVVRLSMAEGEKVPPFVKQHHETAARIVRPAQRRQTYGE